MINSIEEADLVAKSLQAALDKFRSSVRTISAFVGIQTVLKAQIEAMSATIYDLPPAVTALARDLDVCLAEAKDVMRHLDQEHNSSN